MTDPGTSQAYRPQIRTAQPEDEPALLAFGGAVADAAAPPLFAEYLRDGGSFVALADGAIVGYVLAQPLAYDGNTPLTLWIEAVVVHLNWRRRGIATALYRALEEWARASGVTGALTRLPGDEPAARALHHRVGFTSHRDDLLLWRLGNL